MRVLVLHPPLTIGRHFVDHPSLTDLGAVQVAAALRPAHDVRLVDAFALDAAALVERSGDTLRLGASVDATLAACIRDGACDVAIVAVTPFHRPPARDPLLGAIVAGLRAASPDALLILADCYQSGQHHVEAPDGSLLAAYPQADTWVKHEGERAIPALLARYALGERPPPTVRGGEVHVADLPVPAWDLVDLDSRDRFQHAFVAAAPRADWPFPLDGRTLPAITTRGCPHRCIHCSSNAGRDPGGPKVQRSAPPDRVRALVRELVTRHGATRIALLDDALNAHPEHLHSVLDAAEALDVRLEVPNGFRADRLDERAVTRLARRITTLSVSAESGAQRVLDEIVGKRLALGHVDRVAETAARAGIPVFVHYLIGLPGETPEEVNATLRHAVELWDRHGARPAVQYAVALPGTPLAAYASGPAPRDFGPAFQDEPSSILGAVPPHRLRRFRWALERRLAERSPQKVTVNLTYRCNNRCAFCVVGNRSRMDGGERAHRAVLERCRRRGARLVDFDGGEPTLHPALLDLAAHARALGYERVAVTTNGRRCSYAAFAHRLVHSGVTTIGVSLHGANAATHDDLVRVPGAFDQTVAGIRNLVRLGPPGLELGVTVTIARGNLSRIDQVVSLAHDLGVRRIDLRSLTPFGQVTPELAPDAPSLRSVLEDVVVRWRDRVALSIVNLPFCDLPGHEDLLTPPDLGTLRREMVFVNGEEANLADHLGVARCVRGPECDACEYAIACGGRYELGRARDGP